MVKQKSKKMLFTFVFVVVFIFTSVASAATYYKFCSTSVGQSSYVSIQPNTSEIFRIQHQ
ncbi:hypothetical protein GFC30_14 [Anoxybacillus amylolyticus]|uniref:Secreted protein n=1 Tax=Anoxybacteroides amylolyticum TaxID=294699 RepID=A0A160F1G0_9BACL|nr:hypothetical protein GFC30_14 [Anoxybacillus amylolyticus]